MRGAVSPLTGIAAAAARTRGICAAAILGLGCAAQTPPGDPERGAARFAEVGCNGCHLVNGVGGMIGPDLSDIVSRSPPESGAWESAEVYLHESIVTPQAWIVPGFPADMPSAERLELTPQDIDDLVAYLLTLR